MQRCHEGYATSNFPYQPGHSNVVERLIVYAGDKLLSSGLVYKQLGPDVYIAYNMKETNGNIIHKSLCFPLLFEKLVTALKILFLCCVFHSTIIIVIIVNIPVIMIV